MKRSSRGRGGQGGRVVAPVGDQLVQRARFQHGARQDMRADLAALLHQADRGVGRRCLRRIAAARARPGRRPRSARRIPSPRVLRPCPGVPLTSLQPCSGRPGCAEPRRRPISPAWSTIGRRCSRRWHCRLDWGAEEALAEAPPDRSAARAPGAGRRTGRHAGRRGADRRAAPRCPAATAAGTPPAASRAAEAAAGRIQPGGPARGDPRLRRVAAARHRDQPRIRRWRPRFRADVDRRGAWRRGGPAGPALRRPLGPVARPHVRLDRAET